MNASSAINTSIDDTYHTDHNVKPSCYYPVYYIYLITLVIALVLMTTTLILIPCHHRLQKRHHFFPFNLLLADLSGGIGYACYAGLNAGIIEVTREVVTFLGIIVRTSFLVSFLSIVLISGYQFITIRLDPFGARNIITTPRLIVTCVATWAISFSIWLTINFVSGYYVVIIGLAFSWTITIITGLCYIFIYRSIAKVPCDGNITRERKEENQRVLRTFGLVFGTNVLCWICPWVSWALRYWTTLSDCLQLAGNMMISVNWIANSIIYWWRLKEFRSTFASYRRQRRIVDLEF